MPAEPVPHGCAVRGRCSLSPQTTVMATFVCLGGRPWTNAFLCGPLVLVISTLNVGFLFFKWICIFTSWSALWVRPRPQGVFPTILGYQFLLRGTDFSSSSSCFLHICFVLSFKLATLLSHLQNRLFCCSCCAFTVALTHSGPLLSSYVILGLL